MEELEYTPRFNYGSKTLDKLSSPLKLKLKKKKIKSIPNLKNIQKINRNLNMNIRKIIQKKINLFYFLEKLLN